MLVVVDPRRERIAVAEANKLRIPVVALVDTDCDPDIVDIVVPGNDDSMRSIQIFCRRMSAAVADGRGLREKTIAAAVPPPPSPRSLRLRLLLPRNHQAGSQGARGIFETGKRNRGAGKVRACAVGQSLDGVSKRPPSHFPAIAIRRAGPAGYRLFLVGEV